MQIPKALLAVLVTMLILGLVIIQLLLFNWVDSGLLNILHIALFLVSTLQY